MKKRDVILILAVFLLAAISYVGKEYIYKGKEESVVIKVDGEVFGTYSLNKDQEINVDDHNVVVIKDKAVYMKEADCPDKLCEKQGEIDSNKETIVCLPNKTVVEITNEKEKDYDVMVQ